MQDEGNDADLAALCRRALQSVNPESVPGFPLVKEGSPNKLLLKFFSTNVVDAAVYRLKQLLDGDDEDFCLYYGDAMTALKNCIVDPCTPFMKGEPHEMRKLKEERYRIICARGIVDQVVCKVLMDGYSEQLTGSFPNLPSVMGLGTSDEQNQKVGNKYRSNTERYGPGFKLDVSKWDGGYACQLAHSTVRILDNRFIGRKTRWRRAMERYAILMTNVVFVMPDGRLYRKLLLGQMPSGDYMTTIGNCFGLRVLAKLLGTTVEMNLGDDAVIWFLMQHGVADVIQMFKNMRVNVRGLDICGEWDFEFCSHFYWCDGGVWKASLLTWVKSVYGMLSKEVTAENMAGTGYEMRHNHVSEKLKRITAILAHYL